MSKIFELNNVRVTFSTLMNKDEKWGKCFKVAIPEDSDEASMLEQAIKEFGPQAKDYINTVVNDAIEKRNSEKAEGEALEKPVIVRKPDSPLVESSREAGVYEIPFNLYYYKKNEGDEVGYLQLNRKVYPTEDDLPVVYMRDKNTGEKLCETPNGKKWAPCTDNIVNCKITLVAGYNSKDKKATLYFKLLECEIVKSEFGKKGGGSTSVLDTYCVFGGDTDTTEPSSKKAVGSTKKSKAVEVTMEELESIDV